MTMRQRSGDTRLANIYLPLSITDQCVDQLGLA